MPQARRKGGGGRTGESRADDATEGGQGRSLKARENSIQSLESKVQEQQAEIRKIAVLLESEPPSTAKSSYDLKGWSQRPRN